MFQSVASQATHMLRGRAQSFGPSEFESIHMRAALSLLVLVEMVMVAMGARVANGPDYLALKAADKLNVLWGNCIEELQSSRWFNLLQMAGLFVEPMCPVFRLLHDHVHSLFLSSVFLGVHDLSLRTPGDQLEKDRGKFIHTVGAVGKVEWRTSGVHPYTGVFKVGQLCFGALWRV